MNDSDESIARVMAGLRETVAPEGMERRILDAMQDRASVPASSAWRRWSSARWITRMHPVAAGLLACSVAAAILFAAVLVLPIARHPGRTPAHADLHASPAAAPAAAAVSAQPPPLPRNARMIKAKSAHQSSPDRETEPAWRAASYPAPPMPLTEQEKLLLRIAHRNDPVKLATVLTPEVRAKEQQIARAEFKQFFESPPTGETK